MLAEESGWFAGVQFGGGGTEIVMSIAHPPIILVKRFALLPYKNKILKAINGAYWVDTSNFLRLNLDCGIMVRLIWVNTAMMA